MKKISLLILSLAALLTLGAGCATTVWTNTNAETSTAAVKNYDISYAGQDGKNALELLEQNHVIDVTKEGFVNAIDGRRPAERQYWALYVNGQPAAKGAKEISTTNEDQIGWRLEAY